MIGTIGNVAGSVGHFPGNEDAALAANFHAGQPIVETGNDAALPLGKGHRLRIAHLGFPVGPEDGLAVFAHDGLLVVVPGVEFDAVGGSPAGVFDVPELAGFAESSGAGLDVFVVQREGGLQGAVGYARHTGGKLDPGRRDVCDRLGSGRCRGGGLGGRRCRGGSLSRRGSALRRRTGCWRTRCRLGARCGLGSRGACQCRGKQNENKSFHNLRNLQDDSSRSLPVRRAKPGSISVY